MVHWLWLLYKNQKKPKNTKPKKNQTVKPPLFYYHNKQCKLQVLKKREQPWKSVSSSSNSSYWDANHIQSVNQLPEKYIYNHLKYQLHLIKQYLIWERRISKNFEFKIPVTMPKSHFLSFFTWKSINQSIRILIIERKLLTMLS